MGLQHVVTAVVGVITPAILTADTYGLGSTDKTLMTQVSLILTALATLFQLFPIFHRIGSGLPVIMGISFAYIPTLQAIGGESGLSTILGVGIVGGIVAIVFGILIRWICPPFPPLVASTVIFTVGLSLYSTTVRCMAGGTDSEQFGNTKSWAMALITLVVVVFLNHFIKGITKLTSTLTDVLAGYAIVYFLNVVDLSEVGSAAWAALPRPMPFDIQFVPVTCVSLGIVYVVSAVQVIGDLSPTTMDGMDRMPTDEELSDGIVGQGAMSILSAFSDGLPAATYSQNVDIVTVNRVINRAVFVLAALILLIAGLVPKLAFLLTTIPQCVISGATISMFATITMAGTRIITEGSFTPRRNSVVNLSVALSTGITQVPDYLADKGFPAWANTVFGSSSVMVATLMAILPNLILPKESSANG